jgi:type IV pilus assembly protein PilE
MELLVTVVIVGILAAVAIPNFSRSIERARVRDAQTALSAIVSTERIYRLDQGTFGTMADMTADNYIADPDAGNGNAEWDFAIAVGGNGATFTATATRTGGGAAFDNRTVVVNQAFTGDAIAGAPYNGNIFGGNHPLHD